MDTINDAFKEISSLERESLMEAFDNLIPMYIKLSNNRFLGAHVGDDPGLIVEATNGYWFVGTIK
jgi:hypothetical protein